MSSFPESGGPEVGFLPLAPEDAPLLHGWLQQPHVRAFWDDGHRSLEQVRANYFEPENSGTDADEASYIFTLADRPAGYLQTYRVDTESEYARWRSPHGETWGLDLLMGAAADTGRGFGPQVIRAFINIWQGRRPALSRLLIDPDINNSRAIRAYLKAGFAVLDEYGAPPEPLLILALNL